MELYLDLGAGLARAIFLMFLVTDVHPFVDGSGRFIATVRRDDYLLALRALTRRHRPAPLVTALVTAQAFSNLDFTSYPSILQELSRRNWFREPGEARIVL